MPTAETAGYGVLGEMVANLRYKPGWSFHLHWGPSSSSSICSQADIPDMTTSGSASLGLSFDFTIGGNAPYEIEKPPYFYYPLILTICVLTDDAQNPGHKVMVEHPQIVPHEEYHPPWHYWLMECIRLVENHEIGEFFEIAGQRPFYPEHGPNAQLYSLRDRGLDWPGIRPR